MNKLWVVAGESYRRNIKSIGFLVMILMPFILFGIGGLFGYLMMDKGNESQKIAVIAESNEVRQLFIENAAGYKVTKSIQAESAAKKALKNEKIDGYVKISGTGDTLKANYYTTTSDSETILTQVTQSLSSVKMYQLSQEFNLTAQEVASINTPAEVATQKIDFSQKNKKESTDNSALLSVGAYVFCLLIFIFIMNYCSIIGQEIASEKGTRMMEIILSSTKATTHFYGKLIGVSLVCLTQIAIYVVFGIIGYFSVRNIAFVADFLQKVSLREIFGSLIGFNLLFFVGGILLYSVLSAFLGSLVSKIEDVAKAIQPIIFLGMAGFYIGIFMGQTNVEHILVKVTSYIPFFSPFVMPFRIANDSVSMIGIVLSILILFVSTGLLTLISANLYRSNVLIYSDGGIWKSFKQSLALSKSESK